MHVITVVNYKGGCGKSTIAMSLAAALALKGYRTLLLDTDPAADITAWLGLGDGFSMEKTLAPVLDGSATLPDVIQETAFRDLHFVASAEGLEPMGRQIMSNEDHRLLLTHALSDVASRYDFAVIDSPNEITPIMDNSLMPADVVVVPFDGPNAVRRFGNIYALLQRLRGEPPHMLYVVNNLTKSPTVRKKVIAQLLADSLTPAKTEIRSSDYFKVIGDEGGSIFAYQPSSIGAQDMSALADEVLSIFGKSEDMPIAANL